MTMDREELLKAFVEKMGGYGVILLDPNGMILSWNEGASTLLGYATPDVIGREFAGLTAIDASAAQRWRGLLSAARHKRQDSPEKCRGADGKPRNLRCLLQPITDPAGRFLGIGCLLRGDPGAKGAAIPGRAQGPRWQKTVLVVDDNEDARQVAADRLRVLGFAVIEAASGAEALRVLESSADIDMLFTDVVMPGDVDGRTLAEEAQLLRPALRVLFVSGYLPHALVATNQLKPGWPILVKPYSRLQLGEMIQRLLPVGHRNAP
ncbi:response regulator [Reyranella sp.]|uniref:response regulator n=1 Tax=Reyranella sp. TaxID=1929291 RepID=UPI003BA976FB